MTRALHCGVAACALALSLPAPARAGTSRQEALALVSPIEMDGAPVAGFRLVDVQTHPEYVRFVFQGRGCRASLELNTAAAGDPGVAELERYNLYLYESTCEKEPAELIEAVASIIRGNEREGPHLRPFDARTKQPVAPAGGTWAALGFSSCVLYLLAGLVMLAAAASRRRIREDILEAAVSGRMLALHVLLALGVAALLRALDSPWTIANVNSHAYTYVEWALHGVPADYAPNGNGYVSFFHVLFAAGLPRSAETIMAANAVLGSLTVIPLHLLTLVLTRDRWAALAASLLWAVLPAHVRLSTSADFPALLAFSQVAAALAAAVAARHPGSLTLAAAACLAAFSVQVRSEGWVLVAVVPLLFWAVSGWRGIRDILTRLETWVVAVLVLTGVLGPLAATIARVAAGEGAAGGLQPFSLHTLRSLLQPWGACEACIGNLTLNPAYGPPLVPLLAVVGAAALWRTRPRLVIALVASYVLLALAVVGFQAGALPTARLQVSHQWLAVCLAGGGFGWLASRSPGRRTIVAWLAVLAVAAISYLPHRGFVRHLYPPQVEYAFLVGELARVPDGCTVVHLDPDAVPASTELPTWVPALHGRSVDFMWASDFLALRGGRDGCFAFYRGLTCFVIEKGRDAHDEHPLCRQVLERSAGVTASREVAYERYDSFELGRARVPLELHRLRPPPPQEPVSP